MATVRELALINCKRKARQVLVKDAGLRTYQKVTPEIVLDLLENMRGPNKYKARELIHVLATRPWDIRSTVHEGGTAPTAPPHINVEVKNSRQYHLNCKAKRDESVYLTDVGQEVA